MQVDQFLESTKNLTVTEFNLVFHVNKVGQFYALLVLFVQLQLHKKSLK